ncbi:hypothetical protein SAMN05660748_4082, partial [Blastococcus aggregatus]
LLGVGLGHGEHPSSGTPWHHRSDVTYSCSSPFPKTVSKLGIVYTPVEIVDFILRSADEVLRAEFGQGLTDEGVHVLDPFTGTGTFLVRLLQSGLIEPHDLARKYANELHANEILLLAYYIAAANIETTFEELEGTPLPFPGLVLTDSFQSWEDNDQQDIDVMPENNERLERQKQLPIQVIVGNPPYSVGQDSANDDNANEKYPTLDGEIERTYVARSTATSKRTLYDSYIRAIKWATLRLGDRGIVAFVTNGGFLDSNAADGMRQALAEEFAAIHVFNLRGNRRQGGAEGRPIWEAFAKGSGGSIATIAIVVLVKRPHATKPATIYYSQVGDFTTATEKVAEVVSAGSISGLSSLAITPNEHGDWLHQRGQDFAAYMSIGAKAKGLAVFGLYSKGINTARSNWAYGSSRVALQRNIEQLILAYERDRQALAADSSTLLNADERQIKWSRTLESAVRRGVTMQFDPQNLRRAAFRPFTTQWVYWDRHLNDQLYSTPYLFPNGLENVGFSLTDAASHAPFSLLMINDLPDLHTLDTAQYFPRWRYEKVNDSGMFEVHAGEVVDGYRRIDNITDEALAAFTAAYPGESISKDDIFDYVYGLLHSPEYRETYAADLKKMLPRIPFAKDFRAFADAGKQLAALHLSYETVEPCPLEGLDVSGPGGEADYEFFAVGDKKMTFGKPTAEQKAAGLRHDRSMIRYNDRITLRGVPEEAYRYTLGSRSAIEWIIDRYWVKTDKASGIVNDPNDWSREVGDPRYILDLLARIVTVSLETVKVVDSLPPLDIRHDG